ncbi:hypothetical protein [Myxacorys almedinensis]|uniref:Uncharacterized protein n=1 Tax=Myxacorys almedinensis A TaxID=2690445 RepID=A0A8J7Z6V4_9CYAN|nr:hypothetical protein [Myxacorys almedinensis]NDJ19246.1 hypothetical protein [Myxacorys almedinensis A]
MRYWQLGGYSKICARWLEGSTLPDSTIAKFNDPETRYYQQAGDSELSASLSALNIYQSQRDRGRPEGFIQLHPN